MSLVADSIPSLINGVSQQPATLRLTSQVDEQINAHSSEVDGLRKRPPLELMARIDPAALSGVFGYAFKDSQGTPFIALISPTSVRVYDMDGNGRLVNNLHGLSYLAAADPATAYRAVTVADYTYILNRNIAPKLLAETTPAPKFEGLVVFRQGSYGKTYTVKATRNTGSVQIVGTYQVPDGGNAQHSQLVGTDYIASQVAASLTTSNTSASAGFTIECVGSYIYIRHESSDFKLEVFDEFNQNGAFAIKGRTQRFASLPNAAPNGFTLEVTGDDQSSFDNYYVRFEKLNPNDTTGVWREIPKPGILYKFDPDTMPFNLVAEANGTFTFRRGAYKDRVAGDADSIPPPSFLGRSVNDLFVYRNRLGMIAGENLVLSQAGDLFNFWPTTATTVLDDAPIDISAADSATDIHAATPFAQKLVLWAKDKQLALSSPDVLTPRSLVLSTVGNYRASASSRPVPVGKGVFFIKEADTFSRLQELTLEPNGLAFTADDVTTQAPKYIPAGVSTLVGSSANNVVFALSNTAPNVIFVYKFYYSNETKVQSAVYRWEFPSSVRFLSLSFQDEALSVVWAQAGEGTFLGKLVMAEGHTDPDADYLTHLDRRVTEAQTTRVWTPVSSGLVTVEQTRITLPYVVTDRTTVVTRAGGTEPLGRPLNILSYSGKDVIVEGDHRFTKFWVGDTFDMRVRLSTIFVRKGTKEGGQAAVIGGRLQVRYVTINHSGTGGFTVNVTPRFRDPRPVVFAKRLEETILAGSPIAPSGSYRFPVLSRNTDATVEIVDNTFLPSKFQSLEWEGFYTNRDQLL